MPRRYWSCKKCGHRNERTASRKCGGCAAQTKPKPRVPEHRKALQENDYAAYLELNRQIHGVGEVCSICLRPPTTRRLDRDHDHVTGHPRGLLCARCNQRMERGADTVDHLAAALAWRERVDAFYAVAA